ncbi:hypothetical protein CO057_04225 [Candidatus Uhrbacteria bacterium CG_4_9_14_0_2_um_filter_41_50]|uniref:DUF5666 domain-containing protein n=1 Tax=Candidatus Uhrbacteria bacterium CG_4_9_14_0_2_um_filter_41_50 TaxID=1975031 RepID=A0A2M8EN68_9BACT|nr:MAG: hypothetical protein COZ45_03455 [Candidatus Uhrbacteria bacterium CG_4_10_14_3_um_filter_41_21]PIZ55041.1 MAG: hypothetical protein COY24_01870 [Candidatus Uhrbacteria bacterium CG_4_10_14_0_2_um_filter_41_21]PJB84310.1 MAG: hypothetical protein CO086_04260 [Candidatus Uhrbacteria bacterium CG_4_9_14_0_8_um_filter_41_16]PJC24175.1 MAG: hypothetical protein CO057_04225 [Candidatus Uhrbacteria bacterium CG_4_9_14_0_2_um_filter_41_50]PJE75172.1 MAG: hypothetical protein COV03_01550 [Candi
MRLAREAKMSRFMLLLLALLTLFFATPAMADIPPRIGAMPILPVVGKVTALSTVKIAASGQLCTEGLVQFLPNLEAMPDITSSFPAAVVQTASWCLVVPLPEPGWSQTIGLWTVTLSTTGPVVAGYRNAFEVSLWWYSEDLQVGDEITIQWDDINPRWKATIRRPVPPITEE